MRSRCRSFAPALPQLALVLTKGQSLGMDTRHSKYRQGEARCRCEDDPVPAAERIHRCHVASSIEEVGLCF